MVGVGRLLLIIGGVMVAMGLAMWGLGRLGFRGLPGDIRYETPSVRIYIPIATCLVISALLTAALLIWGWLRQR